LKTIDVAEYLGADGNIWRVVKGLGNSIWFERKEIDDWSIRNLKLEDIKAAGDALNTLFKNNKNTKWISIDESYRISEDGEIVEYRWSKSHKYTPCNTYTANLLKKTYAKSIKAVKQNSKHLSNTAKNQDSEVSFWKNRFKEVTSKYMHLHNSVKGLINYVYDISEPNTYDYVVHIYKHDWETITDFVDDLESKLCD